MRSPAWPSTLVAIAVLTLVGWISVTVIQKYGTVDDMVKGMAVFSGLVGVITGAFVSYFFTHQTVEDARQSAAQATNTARTAEEKKDKAMAGLTALAGQLPRDQFDKLRKDDPAVRQALAL
jgi:MFS superfamily sulfate permease-like transporter